MFTFLLCYRSPAPKQTETVWLKTGVTLDAITLLIAVLDQASRGSARVLIRVSRDGMTNSGDPCCISVSDPSFGQLKFKGVLAEIKY